MSNKKRESGYYWVKTVEGDSWEINHYFNNGSGMLFFTAGYEWGLNESDLSEINEERIRTPDEQKLIIKKPQQPGCSTIGLPSWMKTKGVSNEVQIKTNMGVPFNKEEV
tara:strand:+ start:598 stop:924 length:327 start_codon:yes stop_codon:yes gene_type:complete